MIGAIYQCFKRVKCTEFVLSNYRLHYPTTTVVLACDGGEDFSRQAETFNCVYLHEDRLAGPLSKSAELPIGMTANYFTSPEIIKSYFDRLHRCVEHIKEPYFMILEDDVFVVRSTNANSLSFDVNGFNPHETLPAKVCAMFGKARIPYGACGGSIIRTACLRGALARDQRGKLSDLIDRFCENDPARVKWAGDALISYIVYGFGGSIGGYPGFCELWYPDLQVRLRNFSIEVLHQYKALYGVD